MNFHVQQGSDGGGIRRLNMSDDMQGEAASKATGTTLLTFSDKSHKLLRRLYGDLDITPRCNYLPKRSEDWSLLVHGPIEGLLSSRLPYDTANAVRRLRRQSFAQHVSYILKVLF